MSSDCGSLCEAAGLLFLAEVLKQDGPGEATLRLVRMLLAPLCKLPTAWTKKFLCAVSFDEMSTYEIGSMMVAILLGWYAFVPLLPDVIAIAWAIADVIQDAMNSQSCRRACFWVGFSCLPDSVSAVGILWS